MDPSTARALISIVTAGSLAGCIASPGEVTVLFSFGDEPPATAAGLHVSAWLDASDPNARLGSIGPMPFLSEVNFDFGERPNQRPLVLGAQLTDGRWKNSRVLFHGRSESFTVEPGSSRTIVVVLQRGPWPDSAVEDGPPAPAVERIVHRRFPFGADETGGAERYLLSGGEAAVAASARVVVFTRRDVAAAAEIGAGRADESGRFLVTLDASIARTASVVFVAAVDAEERLSDASPTSDGLQASRVEEVATTITAASDERAPKLDRAALLRPALLQTNAERVQEDDELASVRARGGEVLRVRPEPIWSKTDQPPTPILGGSYASMAYDSKRGVLVRFGGYRGTEQFSDQTWEWDGETWRQPASVELSPPARVAGAMAYDAARERVVLFGGVDGRSDLGDVWEWDGAEWRARAVEGPTPAPRRGHAMTYDSDRGRVVLHGGYATNGQTVVFFDDLWEWDGEAWIDASVAGGPVGRAYHTMAYDRLRKRVLSFGGVNARGPLLDLWEWRGDAQEWTRVTASGPEARLAHAMAYDPIRDKLVVFGGQDEFYWGPRVWEWDGSSWSHFDAPGPPPRSGSVMAFDPVAGGVVLFGGIFGSELIDTWVWDGVAWRERTQPPAVGSPSGRRSAAASGDVSHGTALLFGGTGDVGDLDDLWERDRGRWIARRPEPLEPLPSRRYGASMVYDPDRGVNVFFGGVFATETQLGEFDPHTWTFDGSRWSELDVAGPPPRFAHAAAWDATHRRVLIFGGADDAVYDFDLWAWDGSSWTELLSDFGPNGRVHAAMAYDPVRERATVFGGSFRVGQDLYISDATWEWDGAAWLQRTSTTAGPSSRDGAAMVYDAARGNTVLFGGGTPGTQFDETWIWDGTRWTRRSVSVSPPARDLHAMIFDSRRGVVVMFGGSTSITELDDMWEWNGDTWSEIVVDGPRPSRRFAHAMSYDERLGRIFLVGGAKRPEQLRDVWSFDGSSWVELTPDTVAPPSLVQPALAHHEVSRTTLLFGGVRGDGAASSDGWTWDGRAWTHVEGARPPARAGHALAPDPSLDILLFGGQGESGLLSDTWLFDGTTWTQRSIAGPSARTRHAMAPESSGGRVVLYGGSDSAGPLGDTQIWTGTQWDPYGGASPPARDGHAMALDPLRERIVLFGGLSPDALLDDTWEWTRDGWVERHPPGPLPDARHEHVLAFDPYRERVVMFGGTASHRGDPVLTDTWELFAPPDQRAGVVIQLSPERLGIPLDRVQQLDAVVDASSAEVFGWDVREGRWRGDFTKTSSSTLEALVDRQGSIHLLVRAQEQAELELDYFEVTIRHRAGAAPR